VAGAARYCWKLNNKKAAPPFVGNALMSNEALRRVSSRL